MKQKPSKLDPHAERIEEWFLAGKPLLYAQAQLAQDGVRVNGVRPGIIATEIHADSGIADSLESAVQTIPMGRLGQAEEVAAAIAWLLSDEASYTTGATLDVAGGR